MFKKIKSKSNQPFGQYTVLVVEDNEVDRKIIIKTLESLGCQVMTAENGSEGYVKAVSHHPDIILSDCQMPYIDGVEMCRQIKEEETTQQIPVVFLTGVDSPRNVVDCFSLEAESFMCKPINPKELTEQITQILRDHISPKEE